MFPVLLVFYEMPGNIAIFLKFLHPQCHLQFQAHLINAILETCIKFLTLEYPILKESRILALNHHSLFFFVASYSHTLVSTPYFLYSTFC